MERARASEFKDGFVGHPESAPTQPSAKCLNRAMQPFEPHELPLMDLSCRGSTAREEALLGRLRQDEGGAPQRCACQI